MQAQAFPVPQENMAPSTALPPMAQPGVPGGIPENGRDPMTLLTPEQKMQVSQLPPDAQAAFIAQMMGNFGAAAINANESWVTVAEGVWNDEARGRGAEGAVFIARVLWSRPNALVSGP